MTEIVSLPEARRKAARVAARAEIRDVRMLKSAVELVEFPSPASHLRYALDADINVEYEEGATSFVVRIAYNLAIDQPLTTDDSSDVVEEEMPSNGEAQVPQVAALNFELAALFTLEMRDGDEPVKDEELEAYASSTGRLLLFPYAREYVYDVTGRLGLPALTMGVLWEPIERSD